MLMIKKKNLQSTIAVLPDCSTRLIFFFSLLREWVDLFHVFCMCLFLLVHAFSCSLELILHRALFICFHELCILMKS